MTITHTKVVDTGTYPNDAGDPRVQGDEWNDDHVVAGFAAAPASSTDNSVPTFDGVTGELLQDPDVMLLDATAGGTTAKVTSASATSIGLEIKEAVGQSESTFKIVNSIGTDRVWWAPAGSGFNVTGNFVASNAMVAPNYVSAGNDVAMAFQFRSLTNFFPAGTKLIILPMALAPG